MNFLETMGKCSGCAIPNRLCWKSQEFISRAVLYGLEDRVPQSWCFLRSMIHEHRTGKTALPQNSAVVVPLDPDEIDMNKVYWIK